MTALNLGRYNTGDEVRTNSRLDSEPEMDDTEGWQTPTQRMVSLRTLVSLPVLAGHGKGNVG